MGCDIHSVAQVKKDGKWTTLLTAPGGDHRNYDTFAILANVRNGSGFAGCDTGDGYVPISESRGLPTDFKTDEDSDDYHDGKWMGDHSYSHHTLAQIQEYMAKFGNNKTKKRGYVSESKYLELRGTNNSPDYYSGGVSGPDIKTLSAFMYESLQKKGELPKDKKIYVQHEWTVGYTDGTYIADIIEALEKLAKKNKVGPGEVRMVFGFDS